MNYNLSEEQNMIKDLTRKIAEEKIAPVAAELDEKGEFPYELMKVLAQADLFSVYLPQEYGGTGGGCLEQCLVVEELSKVCAGVAVSYAANGLGAYPILIFGSEEQKKKFIPPLACGEKLGAFALTEPDAGSDAAAIAMTARKEGDSYVLNGTKQWITNGGEADIYVIFAMTNKAKGTRGASAFIVEKGTPGFDFGKKENKLGIRSSATRELILNDCKISGENLLSREGMGFVIAMKTFDVTRPGIGAQAVGIADGALNAALNYSRERKQFGQYISSFQAIQHMLADMATLTEAARALVYSTARMIDRGEKNISKDSAMAKVFASDTAMKVTTDAVQIFGGYGYMKEYPVEKMFRDAKITQIYEGTNQIQRNIVALNLIKELGKRK